MSNASRAVKSSADNPKDLLNSVATSDTDLAGFEDKYQTFEQKHRDYEITKLLKKYVEAYEEKTNTQKRCRKVLFVLYASCLGLFSLALLALFIVSCCLCFDEIEISNVVIVISLCVTLLTSVLGLLQIITKYCFPENDEEYITKIVEAIQNNDLENKKENIKSHTDHSDS